MRTTPTVCAILTASALRLRSVVAADAAAPHHEAAASSLAARGLDGAPGGDDGDLGFHEATFIASHNAHAALAVAEGLLEPLGANQDDAIIDQLTNDGVRALLLDIMLNLDEDEPLRLVHSASFLTLDYGGFRTGLGSNLIPFLENDDDAIISFFLETKGDVGQGSVSIRAAILEYLQNIFSSMTVNGVSLKDMTFKYDHDLWKNHDDWPKLDEIRRSGQRIFVFTDRSEFADAEYGFMHNRQVLQENHWEGIDDCVARYMWRSGKVSLPSNDYWTRLFFMNHFCCGSGPESKGNTMGLNLIGGGNNGWGSIYPRIQQCMSNNGGFKPNFIALDWVAQSKEALEIRDYLNFGGKLGTGQTCTRDFHCATSSCNMALGVCQCQQCPINRVTACLGCVSGQYCSSPGVDELNICLHKEGGQSASGPASIPKDSDSPTQSPTAPVMTNQYCGETWPAAVATCNEAVKCPGGNDDCPEGQTCYANLICPPAPTPSPSDPGKPSSSPSYSPSSPSTSDPTRSPIKVGLAQRPNGVGAGAPSPDNDRFCGTDYFQTQANCQTAVPCPQGNHQCDYLGQGFACFPNIVCDVGDGPTPPPADSTLLEFLGITKAPTNSVVSPPTVRPTSAARTSSPSSRPTKSPFNFSNKNYCGGNYTDAEDNCYYRTPCPTGSPSVCGGGTCFTGIMCNAPPSASPTPSPTGGPTRDPAKASLLGGVPGSGSPGNNQPQGNQPQGSQPNNNQPQWVSSTKEPFDPYAFENPPSGAEETMPGGKFLPSIIAAIGWVGLLV